MKRIFTSLLLITGLTTTYAQSYWRPTPQANKEAGSSYYVLDTSAIENILKAAPIQGQGKGVIVHIPTIEGKIIDFEVFENKIMEESLSKRYNLHSYIGYAVGDPSRQITIATAPNHFSSSILKDGKWEFIDKVHGQDTFRVYPRSSKRDAFECHTEETPATKAQLKQLIHQSKERQSSLLEAGKASDAKYRTLRLALSVSGGYTKTFGGVPGALAQMNATMTRVNQVFGNELALKLIMIDKPEIIFTDPDTDPYSKTKDDWNLELQKTLTSIVGDDNYDIGHLFETTEPGGNAGCIGCICQNPSKDANGIPLDNGKGSGYTSMTSIPRGDYFDIDFVAHEMGHQLGGNHTFSHKIEGLGQSNMEPGSGSTIMAYAGVTNANVQGQADDYFHARSLFQIQDVLKQKNCDTETPINNTPPSIVGLPSYTIPKGTAFVLSTSATDAQGDSLTYSWEQYDPSSSPVTLVNGMNKTGPLFRSVKPSPDGNTRYFPRLASVLSGKLTTPLLWESVPNVPRDMTFRLTVRDLNPNASARQNNSTDVKVTATNDGPFKVLTKTIFTNTPTTIQWDVAGTQASIYNTPNVKIDYTTNNGNTWTVLKESTPNDGAEDVDQLKDIRNPNLKIRVSSINNIFYAVSPKLSFKTSAPCGALPTNISQTNLTPTSIRIHWGDTIYKASYTLRYRASGENTWKEIKTSETFIDLKNLKPQTSYQYQLNSFCDGHIGEFSSLYTFTTPYNVCTPTVNESKYEYISNITLSNLNNTTTGDRYTSYYEDDTKVINVRRGERYNLDLSVKFPNVPYDEYLKVYADLNRDGIMSEKEVLVLPQKSKDAHLSKTIQIPADATVGDVYIRFILSDAPISSACDLVKFGEVEDYKLRIDYALSTQEQSTQDQGIHISENPVIDLLNVSNLTQKTTPYRILDTSGRLLQQGNLINGSTSVQRLSPGVYLLEIQPQGQPHLSQKFIKK